MIKALPFPKQAHLFATLSNFAYLDPFESKPKFDELGFRSEFFNCNGSQAYLLTNDEDAIVVCRGTQPTDWRDIAADLEANPVPSSTGKGLVHYGFKHSVDNIWPTLEPMLKELGKKRTIWCTGHSLGAAMATIVAYKLQRDENLPSAQALFTYGSPRVGTHEYIEGITNTGVLHFRFVNNTDMVPRVPVWPYKHFGGMYYMNHWGNLRSFSGWQLTKDVWRGFIRGVKNKKFSLLDNHAIGHYVLNLYDWSQGVEHPQDKI